MPGFVIHLAVAYEYIRKHKGEIKNKEKFFEGILAPDFKEDKYKSHYGNYHLDHIGIKNFVDVNDIDISSDFGKGYFLHLITDEAFYNNYFSSETEYIRKNNIGFYDDYNYTNGELIEYFKIDYIPIEAKTYIKIQNGSPKILDIKKVIHFIEGLSKVSLEEQEKNIKLENKVLFDL